MPHPNQYCYHIYIYIYREDLYYMAIILLADLSARCKHARPRSLYVSITLKLRVEIGRKNLHGARMILHKFLSMQYYSTSRPNQPTRFYRTYIKLYAFLPPFPSSSIGRARPLLLILHCLSDCLAMHSFNVLCAGNRYQPVAVRSPSIQTPVVRRGMSDCENRAASMGSAC